MNDTFPFPLSYTTTAREPVLVSSLSWREGSLHALYYFGVALDTEFSLAIREYTTVIKKCGLWKTLITYGNTCKTVGAWMHYTMENLEETDWLMSLGKNYQLFLSITTQQEKKSWKSYTTLNSVYAPPMSTVESYHSQIFAIRRRLRNT